jgi:hypothetical protein
VNDREWPDGLADALQTLPRELEPGRDLWPGIEARLERRAARPWVPLALAASLVLSGSAAWLAWQAHRTAAQHAALVPALLAELVAPYDEARNHYAASWAGARPGLDPEVAATIERNLEIVRAANGELLDAVQAAPDDAALRALLRATLAAEIELYQRAVRLEAPPI